MDEDERAEIRAAFTDATAIASVAVQGVVAICGELAAHGALSVEQLGRISEFMLASLSRSEASERMQAQLHEAIGHQFSALVAGLSASGRSRQDPEG